MVKKILFLILSAALSLPALAALTSGTVPSHTHASAAQGGTAIAPASVAATGAVSAGSVATSGTVSSTKACAGAFVRVSPNFCQLKTAVPTFPTSLTRDACTTIALPSSDAKALLIFFRVEVAAGNAVLDRYTFVGSWDTSSCAVTNLDTLFRSVREMVATVAATTLLSTRESAVFTIATGASNLYLRYQDDAGNQGSVYYEIRGYYD